MDDTLPDARQRFLLMLREFRPELAEFRTLCLRGAPAEPDRSFVARRIARLKGESGAGHYPGLTGGLTELEQALRADTGNHALADMTGAVLDAALYALTFSGEPPAAGAPGVAGKKRRLVVADDDRIVREMMLQLFSGEAEVFVAANGREAYDLIERHRPHFVILDDFMPEMTGLKLIETLHAAPQLCDIPVLMLTGSDRERDRDRALQAGAVGYIQKPFDPSDLKWHVLERLKMV